MGKAGRVAQVVPEAAPFAGSLWAALADSQRAAVQGKRDAPPGRVACVRFAAAAAWLLALLDGAVLPLQRRVHAYSADEVHPAGVELCFDAGPWGYGAAESFKGKIVAYAAGVWDEAMLQRFKAQTGDLAIQSLWEHLAELVTLCLWALSDEPFIMQGDNLGSLNSAQNLGGRGALLAVGREVAWRRAAFRWRPIFAHRPAELNTICDALSRVQSPKRYPVPLDVLHVPQTPAPEVESLWKAWLCEPPPKTTIRRGRLRKSRLPTNVNFS